MENLIPECFFRAATLFMYVMMAWGILRLVIDIYRFKKEIDKNDNESVEAKEESIIDSVMDKVRKRNDSSIYNKK